MHMAKVVALMLRNWFTDLVEVLGSILSRTSFLNLLWTHCRSWLLRSRKLFLPDYSLKYFLECSTLNPIWFVQSKLSTLKYLNVGFHNSSISFQKHSKWDNVYKSIIWTCSFNGSPGIQWNEKMCFEIWNFFFQDCSSVRLCFYILFLYCLA